MAKPAKPPATISEALDRHDAIALSQVASEDELRSLKRAEEVLEKKYDREQRTRRTARIASAMVGYVALAGFFANAYQNYNNKKESEKRGEQETARWEREFKRAQDSDKYRAFFETSALATDATNADKRLVGYALLKEFVDDSVYNTKAIIMLEESLALELRADGAANALNDQRRLAVVAILSALSHTNDCHDLDRAARTVERLARVRKTNAHKRAMSKADAAQLAADAEHETDDLAEVYELYVRRLLGRAALACSKAKDFRDVREPIRDALIQLPALGGKEGKLKPADANLAVAELLRDGCKEDLEDGLVTDCAESFKGYEKLCKEMSKQPGWADEQGACALISAAIVDLAKEAALPSAAASEATPADGAK